MVTRSHRHGFTLVETLTVIALTVLFIGLASSIVMSFQRFHHREYDELEITQNSRVVIDRISRELRQATVLVTSLPEFRDSPGNPPPSEILFQDGHDTSSITYIRYVIQGTSLHRQYVAYEFPANPGIRVAYNAVDAFGFPPVEIPINDDVTAEYIADIDYWGTSLVHIAMTITKGTATLSTETAVHGRNL